MTVINKSAQVTGTVRFTYDKQRHHLTGTERAIINWMLDNQSATGGTKRIWCGFYLCGKSGATILKVVKSGEKDSRGRPVREERTMILTVNEDHQHIVGE